MEIFLNKWILNILQNLLIYFYINYHKFKIDFNIKLLIIIYYKKYIWIKDKIKQKIYYIYIFMVK